MRPWRGISGAMAVGTLVLSGCFHDFDAFDPVAPGADGSAPSSTDAGRSMPTALPSW